MSRARHFLAVALETHLVPVPANLVPPPQTYEVRSHLRTLPHEVSSRIRGADLLLMSVLKLDAHALSPEVSPNLKAIFVTASGTDSIDLAAAKKRGIHVANTPGCNCETVAEHGLGLYFALRRSLLDLNRRVRAGEWTARGSLMSAMYQNREADVADGEEGCGDGKKVANGTVQEDRKAIWGLPRTCESETLGIIGYGGVGKRLELLGRNLGMRVLIADRKSGASSNQAHVSDRTSFDEVVRRSTVLMLSVPRLPETLNMISSAELAAMPPDAVLVNLSRGGIVDEDALLDALKRQKIAGAATDVFRKEPADETSSPLLGSDAEGLNMIVTPHLAWLSETTMRRYTECTRNNVWSWVQGKGGNKVV